MEIVINLLQTKSDVQCVDIKRWF